MSTMEFVELFDKLPIDKKKVVENLITQLSGSDINDSSKQRMHFGDLKGFVTYISDDFDGPMEEFKDYM